MKEALAREYGAPPHDIALALVEAAAECARTCTTCADACLVEPDPAYAHEHCLICAESCRTCAEACERMMGALVA